MGAPKDHDKACQFIRELIIQKNRKTRQENKQLFIVVVLENLKRVGEGALRWSFFTLNMFMLGISMVNAE